MAKKYNLIAIGRAALDLNAVEYNRPMFIVVPARI